MGESTAWFESLEKLMVRDSSLAFTAASFAMVLVILLNQTLVFSAVIGAVASVLFFLINVVFLGHAFFEDEVLLVRFMLGGLFLLAFLGVVSWLFMIAYSLDVWMFSLALFVVAAGSSVLNRVGKRMKW